MERLVELKIVRVKVIFTSNCFEGELIKYFFYNAMNRSEAFYLPVLLQLFIGSNFFGVEYMNNRLMVEKKDNISIEYNNSNKLKSLYKAILFDISDFKEKERLRLEEENKPVPPVETIQFKNQSDDSKLETGSNNTQGNSTESSSSEQENDRKLLEKINKEMDPLKLRKLMNKRRNRILSEFNYPDPSYDHIEYTTAGTKKYIMSPLSPATGKFPYRVIFDLYHTPDIISCDYLLKDSNNTSSDKISTDTSSDKISTNKFGILYCRVV